MLETCNLNDWASEYGVEVIGAAKGITSAIDALKSFSISLARSVG